MSQRELDVCLPPVHEFFFMHKNTHNYAYVRTKRLAPMETVKK